VKIVLAAILVFSQLTYAQVDQCPFEAQYLEKGQTANCTGILLSPEASKKADEAILDAKHYKELSERLFERRNATNKEISILDQRLKLYMDQSQLLAERVTKKENEDNWQKFAYFGLGVLITGVIAANVKR